MTTIVGCDCGKDSLQVCVVNELPSSFKSFARSYKPKKVKISSDAINYLLELNADAYVLEPTGSYGYIWIDQLQKNHKEVRLVAPRRVTAYRIAKGVANKQDRPDAAAIACYALENFNDPTAFVSLDKIELRQSYLALKNTVQNRSPIHNRLCQRLAYECPELVKTVEGSKREWLAPNAPATIRAISGEQVTGTWATQREEKIKNTLGRGISPHTRFLAKQLCNCYQEEYRIEQQLDALIYRNELSTYNKIFNEFAIPAKTRAALLSAIYPFESFLDENKKEIIEYVSGKKGQPSRRNRSESAFKLSLGMGLVFKESGKKKGWVKGGPGHTRASLWGYVSTIVIIRSGSKRAKNATDDIDQAINTLGAADTPHWLNSELINAIALITDSPKEVAALRLHYQFARPGDIDFKRRMATASRFIRRLYKKLANEIAK